VSLTDTTTDNLRTLHQLARQAVLYNHSSTDRQSTPYLDTRASTLRGDRQPPVSPAQNYEKRSTTPRNYYAPQLLMYVIIVWWKYYAPQLLRPATTTPSNYQ